MQDYLNMFSEVFVETVNLSVYSLKIIFLQFYLNCTHIIFIYMSPRNENKSIYFCHVRNIKSF